jgi:uncharacterized protein YbjT (DUF2867 family)
VVAVARAARAVGATRLAVVSALGADARSPVFYNRVKGEMQDAIGHLGYGTLVIAQPSLLMGDRAALGQPVRNVEMLAAGLLRPLMGWIPRGVRRSLPPTSRRRCSTRRSPARPGLRSSVRA